MIPAGSPVLDDGSDYVSRGCPKDRRPRCCALNPASACALCRHRRIAGPLTFPAACVRMIRHACLRRIRSFLKSRRTDLQWRQQQGLRVFSAPPIAGRRLSRIRLALRPGNDTDVPYAVRRKAPGYPAKSLDIEIPVALRCCNTHLPLFNAFVVKNCLREGNPVVLVVNGLGGPRTELAAPSDHARIRAAIVDHIGRQP